jgi:hypothetical protein
MEADFLVWPEVIQRDVAAWVTDRFGLDCLADKQERARRVLEEAIELAQAEGLNVEEIYKLAIRTYGRPVGAAMQEAAGVGVCLFAWAAASGVPLMHLVRVELERIQTISRDKLRAKIAAKVASGCPAGSVFEAEIGAAHG